MDPKGIAIVITKKKPSKPSGYGESSSDEMDEEGEGEDSEEGIDISEEFQAASDEALAAVKRNDSEGFAKALKSAIILCVEEES